MSKININFNNKVYNVDEQSLSTASNDLKTHLTTKMNGTGAVVDFGGQSHNVDSTKLQNARNEFVAHLGTIVGSGKKVFVNGVEYSIDSTKLTEAISEIEAVLGNLHSDDSGSGDAEPEKNEYGFYFNVPYIMHIEDGENSYDEAMVLYEDGATVMFYSDENNLFLPYDNVTYVKYSYLTATNDDGYSINFSEDGKSLMGALATGIEHPPYFGETYVSQDGSTLVVYPDGYLVSETDSLTTNVDEWKIKGHRGTNYFLNFYVSMDGTKIRGIYKHDDIKIYSLNKPTPALTSPNISIVNDILNITQVENADAYEVYREDELLVTTSALSVDLTQYITEKNTYILVRAISDDYISSEFALAQYGADFIYGLYKEGAITLYETEGAEVIKDMLVKSWGELIINRYMNKVDNTIERGHFMSGDLIMKNGITEIIDFAFRYDEDLTGVIIPDSVTSIGSAFNGCYRLKKVIIPNSVINIGNSAFYQCSALTSINIPNSVTNIGDSAFYGCTSLTSINIPNSVTNIGYRAFKSCTSLTSINIPNSVTNIGDDTFYECSALTSINIPDGITKIGDSAFQRCTALTSINIPNSVTIIGTRAFVDCTALTSINIPDSVTNIGDYVFYDCENLTSITFEGTVSQWNAISKGSDWNENVPATFVQCTDGTVSL